MTYQSLVITFPEKKESYISSADVVIPYKYTLSTIRGQSFFTFGFTIKNEHGVWLLDSKNHYKRLQHCFVTMYERSQLPFSLTQLETWLTTVIQKNSDTKEPLSCSIMLTAGKPREMVSESGVYSTNFGGDLAQVTIIVKPHVEKASWSFDMGINVVTYPYQRPHAETKPNYYMGGVFAQYVIDTINTLVVLKRASLPHEIGQEQTPNILALIRKTYESYIALNATQQKQLRLFLNDIKAESIPIESSFKTLLVDHLENKASYNAVFEGIDWGKITKQEMQLLEKEQFQQLVHDALFVHPSNENLVLEGTTFSLMGISVDDQLVFAPNQLVESDGLKINNDDDGKSLVSTTIECIRHVAEINKLPLKCEKIDLNEITNFKALFAVSSTRVQINKSSVSLQPISSINGISVPNNAINEITLYQSLVEGIQDYFNQYTYTSQNKVVNDTPSN